VIWWKQQILQGSEQNKTQYKNITKQSMVEWVKQKLSVWDLILWQWRFELWSSGFWCWALMW